eukprot:Nk52_evm4s684 gene=Nk52_evmTU4s684
MQSGKAGNKYKIVGKKGEGVFSEVLKCFAVTKDGKEGPARAMKRMKGRFDSFEHVNNLREIQALRRLNPHPNVVEMFDIVFDGKSGVLSLIFELMDMNLYEYIRGRRHYLTESKLKSITWQLCKALDHMHKHGIFHRDIKPENILVRGDVVKLADFGSCRGVYSKQPFTEYISTRWYRSPECLLTNGYYSYKMDLWSLGCVLFEITCLYPMFPGTNELDQIYKIHDVVGTPSMQVFAKLKQHAHSINMKYNFQPKKGKGINRMMTHASIDCIDLVEKLCIYDPDERISARQALKHPWLIDMGEGNTNRGSSASTAAVKEQQQKQQQVSSLIVKADAAAGSNNGGAGSDSKGSQVPVGLNVTKKAHKKKVMTLMAQSGNTNNNSSTENYMQKLPTVNAKGVMEKKKKPGQGSVREKKKVITSIQFMGKEHTYGPGVEANNSTSNSSNATCGGKFKKYSNSNLNKSSPVHPKYSNSSYLKGSNNSNSHRYHYQDGGGGTTSNNSNSGKRRSIPSLPSFMHPSNNDSSSGNTNKYGWSTYSGAKGGASSKFDPKLGNAGGGTMTEKKKPKRLVLPSLNMS